MIYKQKQAVSSWVRYKEELPPHNLKKKEGM